jgi:hypothetical protein
MAKKWINCALRRKVKGKWMDTVCGNYFSKTHMRNRRASNRKRNRWQNHGNSRAVKAAKADAANMGL